MNYHQSQWFNLDDYCFPACPLACLYFVTKDKKVKMTERQNLIKFDCHPLKIF